MLFSQPWLELFEKSQLHMVIEFLESPRKNLHGILVGRLAEPYAQQITRVISPWPSQREFHPHGVHLIK